MNVDSFADALRQGLPLDFTPETNSLEFAKAMDARDEIGHMRSQFIIPTKGSLRWMKSPDPARANQTNGDDDEPSIYLVGNSLGAQPKAVSAAIATHLSTWANIGVNGHFTTPNSSTFPAWQDLAESCATKTAPLVGALPSEVTVMNTLTTNLHLLMATFYRPTPTRHKIIIEWRPFPSDWYAVQSQLTHHGYPSTSLIEIQPSSNLLLSTADIISCIDAHASSTALLLLPGIQYYTGQRLNIPLITSHAQARGIVVGWDLAHAIGNIPLSLHGWNVDFAVWCNYKYLNAGPGAIAGAFVHQRHFDKHRLAGWYGQDKATRFEMGREFIPAYGAAGWQMGNPSGVDLAGLRAALGVWEGVDELEKVWRKGRGLTGWLEYLLQGVEGTFKVLTPSDEKERGSQLSLEVGEEVVDTIGRVLEEKGVVCDVRRPGVIRVAPVPLYCTWVDVWRFVDAFKDAMMEVKGERA
ncbi:hypothetical protein OQA88_5357 [Cercophora sp. LCS_1]